MLPCRDTIDLWSMGLPFFTTISARQTAHQMDCDSSPAARAAVGSPRKLDWLTIAISVPGADRQRRKRLEKRGGGVNYSAYTLQNLHE